MTTETDRELLELAAKAAGMRVIDTKEWPRESDGMWFWCEHGPIGSAMYQVGANGRWNPLTDDGDALRLMVKLKLETEFGSDFVNIGQPQISCQWHLVQESGDDLLVATRRAIVRAAAAIGKAMP